MMILDTYRETPGFPFEYFFQSLEQYSHAQTYWITVLRHAVGFEETHWHPLKREVDLNDDMYTGLITILQDRAQMKEIFLHTFSLPAEVNMLVQENGPQDKADIPEYVLEVMDEKAIEKMVAGTPEDVLRAEAETDYKPFMAWVERGNMWIDQPGHPEGGVLMPTERLMLTAEISEKYEPLALQVFESFIAKGSAMERVNAVFAPPQ